MPWPPQKDELLPRFDEPVGIERKLAGYSLNLDPEKPRAWGKANGFSKMLGIDHRSIAYLTRVICDGIRCNAISEVRAAPTVGYNCLVQFRIAGTGRYSHRTAGIRTVWHLAAPDSCPRLVTAYLDKKEGQ
ncbi:MAG TPA: hypothetical protein VHZ54_17845 [Solirubrobacterales bacterium]|jgi:hypothetical protein|nr:hypothetical protein [Solirubrobacterales bacterium]